MAKTSNLSAMSKNKGSVKRLNDLFAEIGLDAIPEGDSISRMDAISMLEDAGHSLEIQAPHAAAEISETCGKACYRTRNEARSVIKHRKAKGSGPLREYHCPECGLYHITSYILK